MIGADLYFQLMSDGLNVRAARPVASEPRGEVCIGHLAYDITLARFPRQVGIETEVEFLRVPYLELSRLGGAIGERRYELTP
jgi:hypothetical protein